MQNIDLAARNRWHLRYPLEQQPWLGPQVDASFVGSRGGARRAANYVIPADPTWAGDKPSQAQPVNMEGIVATRKRVRWDNSFYNEHNKHWASREKLDDFVPARLH